MGAPAPESSLLSHGAVADAYAGPVIPLSWKMIAQLQLQQPGIKLKEVAKELCVNVQTVYRICKDPHYQAYENWLLRNVSPDEKYLPDPIIRQEQRDIVAETRAKCETYLDEMQDRLINIIRTTDSERLQADLCLEMMDRAGMQVPRKNESVLQPFIVTAEAMADFLSRANEAGIAVRTQPVIEGEVVGRS